MEKLESMLQLQAILDKTIARKLDYTPTQQQAGKDTTVALMAECVELLNEFKYKHWTKNKTINVQSCKEELIDVLHFTLSIAITLDMSANELYDMYVQKNIQNHVRQLGEDKQWSEKNKENIKDCNKNSVFGNQNELVNLILYGGEEG